MPTFLAASDGFNPSDQKKFFSVGTGCRRAPDGAGKLELSVGVPACRRLIIRAACSTAYFLMVPYLCPLCANCDRYSGYLKSRKKLLLTGFSGSLERDSA